MMHLLKSFITLPLDKETGRQRKEPLKPNLDKILIHPEYTLATNGIVLVKINEQNDIDNPYLYCPKKKKRYDIGDYPLDKFLKVVSSTQKHASGNRLTLTHSEIEELIQAHMQAKICRHPENLTKWDSEGVHAVSKDNKCRFKYNFPNKIQPINYNADYMLKILRVVKKFQQGCAIFLNPVAANLITFADHQAILLPIRTKTEHQ